MPAGPPRIIEPQWLPSSVRSYEPPAKQSGKGSGPGMEVKTGPLRQQRAFTHKPYELPCRHAGLQGSLASAGSLVAVEPSWPALNGGLVQNPLRTGSGANSKLQSISSGTEGSPLACSCSLPVVACGNRLHFLARSAVTLGYLPAPWARHGSFYGRRRFGTSNASGALHCTSTGHGIL